MRTARSQRSRKASHRYSKRGPRSPDFQPGLEASPNESRRREGMILAQLDPTYAAQPEYKLIHESIPLMMGIYRPSRYFYAPSRHQRRPRRHSVDGRSTSLRSFEETTMIRNLGTATAETKGPAGLPENGVPGQVI
jgi:hypothetical protein